MLDALKCFSNNEPPGNEGLTKEFHETCWSELEELFMNYSSQIKISKFYQFLMKLLPLAANTNGIPVEAQQCKN